MAGFFQQFLQGAVNGFLDRPNLRDYTHASKTFTTTGYANAPKFKWLFHVYFDINEQEVAGDFRGIIFPDATNYSLLVKSTELPKYGFDLVELNQYNRKRYIQTRIKYDPVRIVFHDDNANQIRQLYYNYYSYYFNDPNQPGGATATLGNTNANYASSALNRKNIYDPVIDNSQVNWGYNGEISYDNIGLGTRGKAPFFKSIRIYGFNQHNFALYQLINPMIDSFSHDTYSYDQTNSTMECSMALRYESVKYYDGALDGRRPGEIIEGFGDPGVYDRTLSPIARPGSNRNIMGKGGLVDSAGGVIRDLSNGNYLSALQTAGRLSRTFKNSQSVVAAAKAELVGGVVNAISNPNTARTGVNTPAQGANTGPGGQRGSATNAVSNVPPPVEIRTPRVVNPNA